VVSRRSPATPKGESRHIPGLDGIRGLAILTVITYHAARNLAYVSSHEQIVQGMVGAGWISVDVFFVLSGFLITGVLLDAKDSATFFRSFYARRVLRIVPLYIVFVTVVVLVAPALGWTTPQDGATLRSSQGWYWSYLVNAIIARRGWSAAPWHTGHLWSLSVEEQFYLLWPVIVFAAGRKTLLRIALGAAVTSAALRTVLVLVHGPSIGMYVLLPVRMDGLAVGAVLAVLARDPDVWTTVRKWAPAGALIALSTLVMVYRRELLAPTAKWTEIAAYPALALLGGAAIVAAVDAPSRSIVGRIFAHPVLRFFGRYSYGLYVWHQLAIAWLAARVLSPSRLPVVAGSHLPGNALFVLVAFGVSLGWALVSWCVVEYPFLALKRFVPYYIPSKKVTTPVSSEYLAPTISKPSF
jgi:peptidoglycan/LPS O-acetylase OafA/YrhL